MKKLITGTIFLSILGLTACSHQDPLTSEKMSPQDTADYLFDAAKAAGKSLQYKEKGSVVYEKCMKAESQDKRCSTLYSAMFSYIKEHHQIKSLNKKDISDKQMWSSIRDYYAKDVYLDFTD